MRMYLSRRCRELARLLCLFCVVFWTCGGPWLAADVTWDGGTNTDGLWSNTDNWTGSPVPGTGNTATFDNAGNGNTTIDLVAGVTVGNMTFDTSSVAGYTIGSGGAGAQTLTLDDVGVIGMTATAANNQVIDANLSIANATITNANATQSLTVAGDITGTSASAMTLTLDGGGAGGINVSGLIDNGGGGRRSRWSSMAPEPRSLSPVPTPTPAPPTSTPAPTVNIGNGGALGFLGTAP